MQYDRYREIRKRNPEFRQFSDRDIAIYIDLYDRNLNSSFSPHNISLNVYGSLCLVLCWFMFNAGSSHTVDSTIPGNEVGVTIMNTAMAATTGLVAAILWRIFEMHKIDGETVQVYDVVRTLNAIMSACVGITASSAYCSLVGALVIGATSAIIYMIGSRLLIRFCLDDPLDVTVIHGVCGFWGVICCGIFHKEKGLVGTGRFE